MRIRPVALALAAVSTVVVSCASGGESGSTTTRGAESGGATPGSLHVVASFYPLQFAAQLIGGSRVAVSNLTPGGAEPHEVELSADDTVRVQDADLVVYLAGFSPSVDETIAAVGAENRAIDVSDAARLADAAPLDGGQAAGGSTDPHFWLDPIRLADVGDAIAERLSAIDPGGMATFAANAATLRQRLSELDGELRAGLASCASRDIVTSHVAFGYLAQRYGLTQVGITGLVPDEEPSPQDLAEIADFVRGSGVTTVYSETLVDPAIAETIAREAGAQTAVLDPIEGLTADSAGSDYFEVMRSNLATLRTGQGCA